LCLVRATRHREAVVYDEPSHLERTPGEEGTAVVPFRCQCFRQNGVVTSSQPPPERGTSDPVNAELILRREPGNTAKLRSFKILADDIKIGTINEAQTEHLLITPGRHRLRLKCDWCSSPEVAVELVHGEPTTLTCRTSSTGMWDFLFRPHHYIDLVPSAQHLAPQRSAGQEIAIRMTAGPIAAGLIILIMVLSGVGTIAAVAAAAVFCFVAMFVPLPHRGSRYPNKADRT